MKLTYDEDEDILYMTMTLVLKRVPTYGASYLVEISPK